MAEVTLTIVADNRKFIQAMKENQAQTQKMYDEVKAGSSKAIGIIEKEEAVLKKLQEWKRKTSAENLAWYNKDIEASKKRLEAYENAGKAEEQMTGKGNKMMAAAKNWALGFMTVTAAVKLFRDVIASTDSLSDKFAATLNGWKEGFASMARAIANNDFKDFFKNIQDAVKEGQRYAETNQNIEDSERALQLSLSRSATELKKLRELQNDANKTTAQRIEYGKEAEEIVKRSAADELKLAEIRLNNDMRNAEFKSKQDRTTIERYIQQEPMLIRQIEIGKKYNELLKQRDYILQETGGGYLNPADDPEMKTIMLKIDALGSEAVAYGELAKGLNNILDIQKDKIVTDFKEIEVAKQNAINLRVSSRTDAVIAKEKADAARKLAEERKKGDESAQKLREEFDKSELESLTGVEKLQALRDYGIEKLRLIREQLKELNRLGWEEEQMLDTMAKNLWEAYYKSLVKEANNITISDADKKKISEALLKGLPELEGLQKSTLSEAEKKLGKTKSEEEFSIWDLFGIDTNTEEGQQQKEALIEAKDFIINTLDEIYTKKYEDAQRNRELLDDRIAEAQRELDTEVDLYKAGYAANVANKQKEVARLKELRDKAIEQERQAAKQKQDIDTIIQASSLITAAAKIFEDYPIYLAIPLVALLLAAFITVKSQVDDTVGLAKGGSGTDKGIVTGRKHSQGGEKFLNHVEVERGEAWGVLSAPATEKYGKVFHHMVSSFNRGELPVITPVNKISNSVLVENSGPNSRLDQVVMEQKKLNAKLSGESVQDFGNMRVIRKGHNMRVIHR